VDYLSIKIHTISIGVSGHYDFPAGTQIEFRGEETLLTLLLWLRA